LVRLLKAKRIDIVHGYLMEGNLLSSLAGFIAGVRIRITSKRSLERYNRKQLLVVKLSNLLSHKVTVVSNAVSQFVQEFEACPATKIAVIPNGVHPNIDSADAGDHADFRQYLAIPKDAFVVGTVARFGWKKGYEYFVQAAAMVARELPSVRFVGLGDGPLKQEIEALADRLGVSDHVVFPGWERDVRQKVALFDVYLCTSIIEGMSNALLEAMAERRPVIATAVGGNRETVRDGVTGYLVPPADPAALARRILELAGDPQLAERMGRAGRASVLEDYSVDRMMARMEDLYSSLIERDTRLQTHEGMSP
jgi:glycosyltransferase involved in cell wall biosynthesis